MPSTWRLICSSIHNITNKISSVCLEKAKLLGSGSSIYSVILSQNIYKIVVSRGLLLFNVAPEKGKIRINPNPNTESDPNPRHAGLSLAFKGAQCRWVAQVVVVAVVGGTTLVELFKRQVRNPHSFAPFNTLSLPPSSPKSLCKDKVSADKSGRSVAYFKASTTPRRRLRQWLRLRQLDYVSSHSSQRGHKKEIN